MIEIKHDLRSQIVTSRLSLYDLPEGWEWKKMSEISDVIGGGTPRSNNMDFYENGIIPWITPADLSGYKSVYISQGARNITELGLASSSAKLLPKDTVLFTSRAPIGYVAIAENPIATNQGFKSFVVHKEKILPKFVYWWLKGNKSLAESYASGTTFLEISSSKCKELPIPLPPLAEQNRIVEKLDAVLSRIDTAIDELQQSLVLVDAMFKSGLDKAFNPLGSATKETGLYDLPDGWMWESLKSVCKFENGDRGKNYPSRDAFVESGIAVINAGALNGKTVDESELNFITRERFDLLGGGKVRRGDLLFCLRGSLGKCAIVTNLDEGAIASSLVIVRPTESILAEYLLNYFNSSLVVQFITKYNNGAAQPNLSAANLAKFELPLPPLAEQNHIVEALNALNDKTTQLKTEITAKIGMFNQLKASVLDGAFRGEI